VQKSNKRILATAFCAGKVHDFALFKVQGSRFKVQGSSTAPCRSKKKPLACVIWCDLGYKGIQKQHENSRTPHKKSKHHPLTPEQRQENKGLACERLDVEHVIGWLKRFRLLCGPYRNRRKRLGLRFNLIAALYNALLDL
jgi:hypothetical protein